MKLEITRAFAMCAAVVVCALASVAWSEPALKVLTAENGLGYCPVPAQDLRLEDQQVSEDFLLLMFSLSQGRGGLS